MNITILFFIKICLTMAYFLDVDARYEPVLDPPQADGRFKREVIVFAKPRVINFPKNQMDVVALNSHRHGVFDNMDNIHLRRYGNVQVITYDNSQWPQHSFQSSNVFYAKRRNNKNRTRKYKSKTTTTSSLAMTTMATTSTTASAEPIITTTTPNADGRFSFQSAMSTKSFQKVVYKFDPVNWDEKQTEFNDAETQSETMERRPAFVRPSGRRKQIININNNNANGNGNGVNNFNNNNIVNGGRGAININNNNGGDGGDNFNNNNIDQLGMSSVKMVGTSGSFGKTNDTQNKTSETSIVFKEIVNIRHKNKAAKRTINININNNNDNGGAASTNNFNNNNLLRAAKRGGAITINNNNNLVKSNGTQGRGVGGGSPIANLGRNIFVSGFKQLVNSFVGVGVAQRRRFNARSVDDNRPSEIRLMKF